MHTFSVISLTNILTFLLVAIVLIALEASACSDISGWGRDDCRIPPPWKPYEPFPIEDYDIEIPQPKIVTRSSYITKGLVPDWYCIRKRKVQQCLQFLADEDMEGIDDRGCCSSMKRSCGKTVSCVFSKVCDDIKPCEKKDD